MKRILILLFIGLIGTCYGQDSTKTKLTPVSQQNQVVNGGAVERNVSFGKIVSTPDAANVKGSYIIERVSVQINSPAAKKSMTIVGNPLIIDEVHILGEEMDTISYSVYETEMMDVEDYLFRIFGEVPSTIPDDLPNTVLVHKTDNLDCYGIAELREGLILIPYNGLLLYLRRY